MTLYDLERKNRGVYGFFGDFGLQHTFQEWQHSREMMAPSGVGKYIVPNVSCWIDELRFFLQWAFKHAPLSCVYLCVCWAFLATIVFMVIACLAVSGILVRIGETSMSCEKKPCEGKLPQKVSYKLCQQVF